MKQHKNKTKVFDIWHIIVKFKDTAVKFALDIDKHFELSRL